MARSRIVNLANFEAFQAINVLSDPGHIGGPQVIPQCVQVRLIWHQDDGRTAYNVLHARYTGLFSGNVAMANALLTGFSNLFSTSTVAGYLANSTTLTGVDLRDLNSINNPLIQSTGAQTFGGGGAVALPNEVAACLTFRTSKAGIANRGRTYLPGWAAAAMGTGNVILAGAMTALTNIANGWLGVFTAQALTATLALPARNAYTGATGTQHPARAAQTMDITQVSVRDNHWDSQRRRGLK